MSNMNQLRRQNQRYMTHSVDLPRIDRINTFRQKLEDVKNSLTHQQQNNKKLTEKLNLVTLRSGSKSDEKTREVDR